MDFDTLQALTFSVCQLARTTGDYIRKQLDTIEGIGIEEKGRHDFVTDVDKDSEQLLIDGLKPLVPNAGFLAEENTANTNERDFMWIIDPLDGTTNFIHSIPVYSISIALRRNNKTIMGVVYEINMQECFYAWEGSKVYLNAREVKVSPIANMDHSLFATGFPYYNFTRMNQYMAFFSDLMKNSSGIRRLGSAAVDLAYVACGRFEGFFEYSLRPWDIAAGAFLVKQAGGLVCDFKGGEDYISGKEIVATNKAIHSEFMEKIKLFF